MQQSIAVKLNQQEELTGPSTTSKRAVLSLSWPPLPGVVTVAVMEYSLEKVLALTEQVVVTLFPVNWSTGSQVIPVNLVARAFARAAVTSRRAFNTLSRRLTVAVNSSPAETSDGTSTTPMMYGSCRPGAAHHQGTALKVMARMCYGCLTQPCMRRALSHRGWLCQACHPGAVRLWVISPILLEVADQLPGRH